MSHSLQWTIGSPSIEVVIFCSQCVKGNEKAKGDVIYDFVDVHGG